MSERLQPLTDERVAQLARVTRNGPDVVALAQEVQESRKLREANGEGSLIGKTLEEYAVTCDLLDRAAQRINELVVERDEERASVREHERRDAAEIECARLRSLVEDTRRALLEITEFSTGWKHGHEGVCLLRIDDLVREAISHISDAVQPSFLQDVAFLQRQIVRLTKENHELLPAKQSGPSEQIAAFPGVTAPEWIEINGVHYEACERRHDAQVVPDFLITMTDEQRREFVERFNALTPEQIRHAAEKAKAAK